MAATDEKSSWTTTEWNALAREVAAHDVTINDGAQSYDVVADGSARGDATYNGSAWVGTDDTAALVGALAAAIAAGRRKITFRGTFLWDGATNLAPAGSVFNGVDGIELSFEGGAKIVTNHVYAAEAYVSCFIFTNCKHVRIKGFHGEAPVLATDTDRHSGPVWVDLTDCCDDFDVRGYHQSGLGLRVSTTDYTDDTKRTHGGYVDMRGYVQSRVCDFQNSGDNVRANIMGDGGFRTYLAYGVQNHKINVKNRNGVDAQAILQAFNGQRPTENIEIAFADTDTTVSRDGAQMLAIYFIGPNPGLIRNITFLPTIEYGGATVHQGTGIQISKFAASGGALDTLDRGHVLDGFTVKGRIDGRSFTGDTSQPITTSGTWGGVATPGVDVWRNVDIDLQMNAAAGTNPRTVSPFHLASIAGRCRLDMFSANTIAFNNAAGQIASMTSRAVSLVYGVTVTPSAVFQAPQKITVTNGSAFTIAAPLNPLAAGPDRSITIEVLNSSGGAMGTITWNGAFVLAGGAFTNPASTKRRQITFGYDGTNWVERFRSSLDY